MSDECPCTNYTMLKNMVECYIWIHPELRSVVTEAGIKGRDKELHPTETVGYNYLSLPLIHTVKRQCKCVLVLVAHHQIPYLVPRTANWLSPLWSNTDHWPYAAGVCIVTGMSWWILHSRLVECSLRDNSWDLHSRIPARSGILLSDMM